MGLCGMVQKTDNSGSDVHSSLLLSSPDYNTQTSSTSQVHYTMLTRSLL